MAAEYSERLGLRMRPGLRRLLDASGDPSAAARALILIGLSTLGVELGPYRADLVECMPKVIDPAIHRALLALLNPGSTAVEHLLKDAPYTLAESVASTDDQWFDV